MSSLLYVSEKYKHLKRFQEEMETGEKEKSNNCSLLSGALEF